MRQLVYSKNGVFTHSSKERERHKKMERCEVWCHGDSAKNGEHFLAPLGEK